jgi:hypothetical protein
MPGPVPQPPKHPPPPTIAEQRPLGNLFGIQDETFNRYMRLVSTSKDPDALEILEGCVDNFEEDAHPLIQYAAASAATELALRIARGLTEAPYSFEMRKAMLDRGRTYCLSASEGFSESSKRHLDPDLSRQLGQMGIQALHLAAYTPLMEVMAANIADHYLPDDTIEAKRAAARTNVAHLGELVLGMNSASAIRSGSRTGLRSEAACGMVGQGDTSGSYFVFPASLRQDHNHAVDLRADLIAMQAGSPFQKTLLQVGNILKSGSRGASSTHNRVQISASRDLVLRPGWSVDQTLEAYIALAAGTASPEIEQLFAAAGQSLSKQIDNFTPGKKRKFGKK